MVYSYTPCPMFSASNGSRPSAVALLVAACDLCRVIMWSDMLTGRLLLVVKVMPRAKTGGEGTLCGLLVVCCRTCGAGVLLLMSESEL